MAAVMRISLSYHVHCNITLVVSLAFLTLKLVSVITASVATAT